MWVLTTTWATNGMDKAVGRYRGKPSLAGTSSEEHWNLGLWHQYRKEKFLWGIPAFMCDYYFLFYKLLKYEGDWVY